MMVRLFVCVLCVFGWPVAAKELSRTAPEKTAMSSERLARINALRASSQASDTPAGCTAAALVKTSVVIANIL